MQKRFVPEATGMCCECGAVEKTNSCNLCKSCWKRVQTDPIFRARVEANPRSGLMKVQIESGKVKQLEKTRG